MARVQIGNVYPSDKYLLERCAPAGFGLGVPANYVKAEEDVNTIFNSGYYILTSATKNSPIGEGILHVLARTESECVQEFFSPFNNSYCRRKTIAGSDGWDEVEWENPSMTLGIEYRTTERYLGKPVYTKLFDFGASADGASIAHELNPSVIVRYSAVAGSIPLPHFNTVEPEYQITVSVGATNITMACGESRTGLRTCVQVWYIKD